MTERDANRLRTWQNAHAQDDAGPARGLQRAVCGFRAQSANARVLRSRLRVSRDCRHVRAYVKRAAARASVNYYGKGR